MPRAVGVIPARYASTRFPGKPLASLQGKPLVQHVWERAILARRLARVVVATDDERIRRAVAGFGGRAIMTAADHATGTDRVQEAVRRLEAEGEEIGVVLNIQGDEALVDPEALDGIVEAFEEDPSLPYATLAEPFTDEAELADPNTCKIVTDASGNALYFSRSAIPFFRAARAGAIEPLGKALSGREKPLAGYLRHVGIYGFRRGALDEFSRLPKGELEIMEGLEQLRVLEAGLKMRVVVSSRTTMDVDLPDDVAKVESILADQRLVQKERG